ncbi:MAG: preprotein translocase subunit SecG [Treponema sp.]|jgi:preprotein translocase subunit SecG|nr:preprotein translocase subunit SecG [Treponema sp.]
MGVLSILLLVFFVIIAVLLILLVLVQNEEGDNLGGIFAGGSGTAFGSRSGNVLTRATTILGALFLVISFGLALLNRTPGGIGVERAARQLSTEATGDWWQENGEESSETENSADGAAAAEETPEAETAESASAE